MYITTTSQCSWLLKASSNLAVEVRVPLVGLLVFGCIHEPLLHGVVPFLCLEALLHEPPPARHYLDARHYQSGFNPEGEFRTPEVFVDEAYGLLLVVEESKPCNYVDE